MVLDVEMPMEDSLTEEQQEIVESAAEMLYGLIHARYVACDFKLLVPALVLLISSLCQSFPHILPDTLLPTEECMLCMKNTGQLHLGGAQGCSAKDNLSYLWASPTYQGITLSMSFVLVATDFSSPRALDRPTLTVPTLEQPFHICIS